MHTKEEALRDVGLEEIIETSLMEGVHIIEGKTGDDGNLYGYTKGGAWYILRGRVKITSYFEDGSDFFWEYEEGEWFGMESAVLKAQVQYDAEAYSDVVVLEIPLREIFENENTSKKLLKRIIEIMAISTERREEKAVIRMGYGDEIYFLKYLERNNFDISYNNLRELSDILNINNRTFQRILKKLLEKGIICKARGRIGIKEVDVYRRYLETLSQ